MFSRLDDRRAFLQLMLAGCALPYRSLAWQEKAASPTGITLDAKAG
jgi:hypothetical protein